MTPEGKVLHTAIREAALAGAMTLRLSFRVGVAVGWPDLLLLFPGARILFMECKRLGGEPTPRQAHIMGKLRELGFATAVCDSSDSARSAIASAVGAFGIYDAGCRSSQDTSERGPTA